MNARAILSLGLSVALAPTVAFAQDKPDAPALYQQYCAQCHGATLQGGNGQSLVDGIWNFGGSSGSIRRNIKHGITHLGMPAYEGAMEDDDIRALTDFLLAKEKEGGAEKPPVPSEVQTQDYIVGVETWVEGLDTPWGMAFLDDDTALITERPGTLRLVKGGKLADAPITGTPVVHAEGQGGLLDVATDPDYIDNGWIYLAYSHSLEPNEEGGKRPAMTRIVRGKLKDGAWTEEQTLFEAPKDTYVVSGVHYGCRIVFDAEGHLYFSIGERGSQDHAQDLSKPNGKVHRIHRDGTIPDDNPFVKTAGALPSIYTYGNRNPQGLAVSKATGLLWESEHGPMGGDELNVMASGKNYGWPVITYGRNYNGSSVSDLTRKEGMEQPRHYWRPSIAVCGIDIYTGSQFPKWENAVLVGALRYESVAVLQTEGDHVLHEETILKNVGRVRDVVTGPEGAIYVVTNSPNAVLRLTARGERSY